MSPPLASPSIESVLFSQSSKIRVKVGQWLFTRDDLADQRTFGSRDNFYYPN
jgi:hypothetical protein